MILYLIRVCLPGLFHRLPLPNFIEEEEPRLSNNIEFKPLWHRQWKIAKTQQQMRELFKISECRR